MARVTSEEVLQWTVAVKRTLNKQGTKLSHFGRIMCGDNYHHLTVIIICYNSSLSERLRAEESLEEY